MTARAHGKGTRVDKGGRPFEGLHQVRLDGSFISTVSARCHTEIFGGNGFALFARGNNHFSKPVAHIFQACCQRQDRHDLGRR